MKTEREIQYAHDAVCEMVDALKEEPTHNPIQLITAASLKQVLCWALGHADDGTFATLLKQFDAKVGPLQNPSEN